MRRKWLLVAVLSLVLAGLAQGAAGPNDRDPSYQETQHCGYMIITWPVIGVWKICATYSGTPCTVCGTPQ